MRFSASITLMFQEVPLLERFAAARAAGFEGVEIQRLAEGDVSDMARAARDAGVRVALVNVPSADYSLGGDGLSGVPGREHDFHDAFAEALHAAHVLGAEHVHLGPSRIPTGVARAECIDVYHANIRSALTMSRSGKTSLLEAMNGVDAPTALLADLAAAADVLRVIKHGRLGLQFDVYHAAMNGDDVVAAFARYKRLVRHVQFADAPGRHEPGTGRLDLPMVFRAIDALGYDGWIGAEYLPSVATTQTLGWMRVARGAEGA